MASLKDALNNAKDPSIRHVVSLSGGKDSTALAIYLRQQYPEIQSEYVFCDTGCELPETYEYLEKLQAVLGAEIVHLNALDTLAVQKKPNRTPFDIWLNEVYGGFLPSPRARWCTRVLKIEPFEKYIGPDQAYSYIGIRSDESREGYISKKPPVISQRPNIVPVYPFKDDGIGLEGIQDILTTSGLGVPDYYKWRSRSGCYFCFYQQIGEWQRLRKIHPDLFEKAKAYEETGDGSGFRWRQDKSLSEIAALEKEYTADNAQAQEGCAICHI